MTDTWVIDNDDNGLEEYLNKECHVTSWKIIEKSPEWRKQTHDELKETSKNKLVRFIEENDGLIHVMCRRIYCVLFRGHTYKRCTPEDIVGHCGIECTYCKKYKVV